MQAETIRATTDEKHESIKPLSRQPENLGTKKKENAYKKVYKRGKKRLSHPAAAKATYTYTARPTRLFDLSNVRHKGSVLVHTYRHIYTQLYTHEQKEKICTAGRGKPCDNSKNIMITRLGSPCMALSLSLTPATESSLSDMGFGGAAVRQNLREKESARRREPNPKVDRGTHIYVYTVALERKADPFPLWRSSPALMRVFVRARRNLMTVSFEPDGRGGGYYTLVYTRYAGVAGYGGIRIFNEIRVGAMQV